VTRSPVALLSFLACAAACGSGPRPPTVASATDDVCSLIARRQTEMPDSLGFRNDCYRITVCVAPGTPFSGLPAAPPFDACPEAIFAIPRSIPQLHGEVPKTEGEMTGSARACALGRFDADRTVAARATCAIACCYDTPLLCPEIPPGSHAL
jgi:hypothetical protein